MYINMVDPTRLLQVREIFTASGMTVADWARQHRFSTPIVYAVLQGRSRASRGESLRIAIALGLKDAYTGPLPPSRSTVQALGDASGERHHSKEEATMKA